jgi:hypothetical protein
MSALYHTPTMFIEQHMESMLKVTFACNAWYDVLPPTMRIFLVLYPTCFQMDYYLNINNCTILQFETPSLIAPVFY